MKHLTRFSEIASNYDGFVIDLWGVIHDGVTPYAGAVDCLSHLQAAGKSWVLLSNAPRRAHVARQAMRGMNIPDMLTTNTMTSGEAVWLLLRDRNDAWSAALGRRVFHIGQPFDRNVLENLDYTLAETPADADFVLNTGAHDGVSLTDLTAYELTLAACLAAGLPMLCANPDLEVIREGQRWICAGAMAARYETLGGQVRWIGKPDPAIYTPVLATLACPPNRILAVGDALRTDMAGAAAAGIDGCWVLGGIHADELGNNPALVEHSAHIAGLAPVAAIPAFIW